jgi:CRP-like cAMP-binding protein
MNQDASKVSFNKMGRTTEQNFNKKKLNDKNVHVKSNEIETPKTNISFVIWMYKPVEVLQSKQNFGEMALVDEKKLRSATVTCETDCEILILSRDTYEHTLDKALRRDRERRIQML